MKYVNQLTDAEQAQVLNEVETALEGLGLEGTELDEAVEDAMNSKVNDLSDLIDINKYI